jgi:hypothetical protein
MRSRQRPISSADVLSTSRLKSPPTIFSTFSATGSNVISMMSRIRLTRSL